jgi:hypothetical protein
MGRVVFGRYEVLDRIAVGGMGEVYAGRSVAKDGAQVVLKTLLPELAEQPEHVEQFVTEARIAAALDHPGIVRTLDVGCDEGTYYLVMERIDGANLAQLLRASVARGERVRIEVAVRIAQDAARALHAAHVARDAAGRRLGIVHRDVTPHNLMVSKQGDVKVVDFGIAKSTLAASRTRTGTIKGKIPYMSPEQIQDHRIDARTDQFSLGAVLWELLCGRRLFAGENEVALLRLVTECRCPPVAHHRGDVPPDLARVVARMLAMEPTDRFATLADAADALPGPAERADVAAWVGRHAAAEGKKLATPSAGSFVVDLRSPTTDATAPVDTASMETTRLDVTPRDAPVVRAAWSKTVLEHVDKLPRRSARAIREATPPATLTAIEGTSLAAFISVEHHFNLVTAADSVLGPEDARALWHESLLDAAERPFLKPIVYGALAMFGGGPRAIVRAIPRGHGMLFRNCGSCVIESLAATTARVVWHNLVPTAWACQGWAVACEGAYEAVYSFAGAEGTVRCEIGSPTSGDMLLEMSWLDRKSRRA